MAPLVRPYGHAHMFVAQGKTCPCNSRGAWRPAGTPDDSQDNSENGGSAQVQMPIGY